MIRETVKLMPGRDEVYLDYYGNDDRSEVADAMLVIPGGGYGAVCSDREGEPIALSYLTKGINAFVLHYSVGGEIKNPLDPLTEASLAMLHIRANAQKYNIDPARVFAVGFSAGGHLAGSLGTLWNDVELQARLPEAGAGNRPTGVVLCYPVISSSNIGHMGSFSNLLRSQTPDAAALERFSLEKHVGAHTSPAFIMHTYDDGLVPVENSLLMAQAYAQAHRPFEMHIYPHGPHGIALANKVTWGGNPDMVCPAAARWVSDSVEWMKTVG